MYVTIDNIRNQQIFQQCGGAADIAVSGRVLDKNAEEAGNVYAQLMREYDFTCVTNWVRCECRGAEYTGVLRDVPSGGHYQLRVKWAPSEDTDFEINGDVRFHLGVGDIWLIAGQSNAVGYGKTPAVNEADPRAHLLAIDGSWRDATAPLSEGYAPLTEGYLTGASPCVSFANTLVRALNYPIGLVQTALGGTPISAWQKDGALQKNLLEKARGAGGRVKGVLWHQGCRDTGTDADARQYLEAFTRLTRDVRAALDAPELPFLTVQLNKTFPLGDEHIGPRFAMVKEAQRRAGETIDGVYVAPSIDLGLSDWVHNNAAANLTLGQRLAWLALECVYGQRYMGRCPDVQSAVLENDTVRVCFAHVYGHLVGALPPGEDFIVEDAQGVIPHAPCRYERDAVLIPLLRAPVGDAACSFAPYHLNTGFLPFDRATGMPPLAFYRYPVTAEKGAAL